GNVHDSQVAIDLVKQSKTAFPHIKRVSADARYKTPKFVHFLSHLKLYPILPYTAPHGVKGMFCKIDFVYNAYFNCYLSPNDQSLLFSTITRDGYRTYKSNPKYCRSCSLRENCTSSANYQKIVTRQVWADLMDEFEHQRHTVLNRKIYKKRKQTIERIFSDEKRKAWYALDEISRSLKSRHAHDAYVCCHEKN
ncbi:IS4 family transposase, partial [Enterococcus mundtii]